MTPAEVGACSLWQFEASVAGWVAANCPEDEGKLTAEDEEDLWAGVMERMG